MFLLTLLFLGVVGLRRTWDLRGYTGEALGLLTGRKRAYGYSSTERFLSQVARASGAERFTNALATWTAHLWHPSASGSLMPSTCYVDGHRKPVYTERLVPRGLVGRLRTVLGCRALVRLARCRRSSLARDYPSWGSAFDYRTARYRDTL
jgi:hypothetical protein